MSFNSLFEQFAERAPAAAMARALAAYAFRADFLDDVFRNNAQRQYEGELLFSTGVRLLSLAVTRTAKSLHSAYQIEREEIGVSFTSLCNKINGVELNVSRELIRQSAERLATVSRELKIKVEPVVPGFKTFVIDGNHLASTEHRLEPLRKTRRGPLPGQAIVFLDADRRLLVDAVLCEDGHAQERRSFLEVLEAIGAGQLCLADRNFCTLDFLSGVNDRGAFYLIRRHRSVSTTPLAEPRSRGRCSTGTVQECDVQVGQKDEIRARLITIQLDRPTQQGDREVQLLTNLSSDRAKATVLADAYLKRWKIEHAFQELGQHLRSEIDTLAYPPAALLAFSISLVLYNIFSVVQQGFEDVHGEAGSRDKISMYYLVGELAGTYQGMMMLTTPGQWTKKFGSLTPQQMVVALREVARPAYLLRYEKHKRGPKKKTPRKESGETNHHVSTAKLLAEAKASK